MTSKLTRERLQEIAEDGFLKHGESKELARMALAEKASEPVILYRERNPYNGLTTGWQELTENEFSFLKENAGENADFLTLYRHAQPAPVVPDEIYARTAFEAWYKTKYAFQGYEFEITDSGTYVWDNVNHMWNGYRAAMLAAATHDTHARNSVQSVVTAQGWIPVSERMPEDRTQVILWDAEIGEVTSGHYSHKTQTFYHCGDAIENEITHWMAPPAAPQEVRGE